MEVSEATKRFEKGPEELSKWSAADYGQAVLTRLATWYLRDCPVVRGRGFVNRLLGNFLEVRTLDGIRIRLINPLEHHQRMLLFGAPYEPEVTVFLREVLRPGMVFIDVGANLGYYTLLGAKRVGSRGQVHAFEPAPLQFQHLTLNVRTNQVANVVLNKCAVADHVGEIQFFVSDGWNQGTHSLGMVQRNMRARQVKCTSLDEYVSEASLDRVDVVKMDVEGAELLVCRGARRMLASLKPAVIVFEACEKWARAVGHSTRDVKGFLEDCGYTMFRLEAGLAPVRAEASAVEEYANLVGIHAEAPELCHEQLECAVRKCLEDEGLIKEQTKATATAMRRW